MRTKWPSNLDHEVIQVFTAKSVEVCLEVGGTQSWALDRVHARQCKYAVLCRNAHTDWGDGKEPHGSAFMIGRVSDVVPSMETEGRWLVKFDQYARIDIPNLWEGWRNPVRYTNLKELGISLDDVQFEPMPQMSEEPKKPEPEAPQLSPGLTIAEAKKGLALTFGVKIEEIEIIIRG